MNLKQLLLTITAFTCITSGLSASIQQLTPQEIAKGIANHEISINDQIFYDGAIYTITNFEIKTNDDDNNYKNIYYTLTKPFIFLNTECGTDVIIITAKEGKSYYEVYHNASISRYRTYNDNYRLIEAYAIGSAVVLTSAAITIFITDIFFKIIKK